jgi:hypothetical protein
MHGEQINVYLLITTKPLLYFLGLLLSLAYLFDLTSSISFAPIKRHIWHRLSH